MGRSPSGRVVQVDKHFPSQHKVLSSNPRDERKTEKKKNRARKKERKKKERAQN
jgi:hypothetical protein